MFQIKRKLVLSVLTLIMLALTAFLPGCGLRQSQTGSLSSRIIDADGNAVVDAEVFSIFSEIEKVRTGLDGGFYLSELPAGINNIVILHPDFAIEERQIEIKPSDATVVDFIRLDQANAPNRISDVKVQAVSSSTATISWNTYRSVVCNVDYGKTMSYGSIYRETRPSTEHTAVLSGLDSDSVYHFRVQYIDESSVSYYSYDLSFRTDIGDRPAAPGKVSIRPLQAMKKIELEWSAAAGTDVKGYRVYRSETKDDVWVLLNETSVGSEIRTFADITAEPGAFYRYAVVAVNGFYAESEKTVSDVIFVPGIIDRNVDIRLADSPVKIYADLIIAAGANLTAEAGVEFLIDEKDAFASGNDEQRIEIIAHGRIGLVGSQDMPILFAPLGGAGRRDHWAGITVLSHLSGISQLEHVRLFGCSGYAFTAKAERVKITDISISYCENGMMLSGLRDALDILNSSFSQITQTAVNIDRCRKVRFENASFSEVKNAVSYFSDYVDDQLHMQQSDFYCDETAISGSFGKLKLQNLLIVVPDGTGIILESALNSRENYIDHCTVDARDGILVKQGEYFIENNIIVNRAMTGSTGINNISVLTPDYVYNNIYGFNEEYSGCQGGIGAVGTDPKFAGGNPFSYELQADSTLKLQDRYGSEMGRYGNSRY